MYKFNSPSDKNAPTKIAAARGSLPQPDKLLQMYRNRAGLTQAELGKLIGLSRRMVLNWEAGYNLPRPNVLKKLVELYLQKRIFTHGRELEEAQALWEQVEEFFNRKTATNTLYPIFDLNWFNNLLQILQVGKNSDSEEMLVSSQELPDGAITFLSTEVVISPNNLPAQLTSFTGREKDMSHLRKVLLEKTRLLTLSGAGGIGKTRLALEVAGQLLPEFKDGVWLVELAALADPALVPQRIAQVLNIKDWAAIGLEASLIAFLKKKELLLVIDNCEHLLEACVLVVEALLKGCPNLRVLATSREALALMGEAIWRVPSLALPEPGETNPTTVSQAEAVKLFVQRAAAIQSGFEMTSQNAAAVVQICRQLDGIPLALELAAARVQGLGVEQLALRLDARFSLLTEGNRSALPRQQTLRATIEWSYNLLVEAERIMLRRLAVFAGGWNLEAAEAVGAGNGIEPVEILGLLLQLVNKSLVIAEEAEADKEKHYHILETLREFARDKLNEQGELIAMRQNHLAYFVRLVEELTSKLHSPAQLVALKTIDSDYNNIREALEWAIAAPSPELALRLGGALGQYWDMQGYLFEGRAYLEKIIALPYPEETQSTRATILNWLSTIVGVQGDLAAAKRFANNALEAGKAAHSLNEIAIALKNLAIIARFQGDFSKSQSYIEESLALRQQIGNQSGIAQALSSMGALAKNQGDYLTAQKYVEKSLALYRELGDRWATISMLNLLSSIAIDQKDYFKAENYLEQSIELEREFGNKWSIIYGLTGLGQIAHNQKSYAKAQRYLEEALRLAREFGDRLVEATILGILSINYVEQGDYATAHAYFVETLTLHRTIGDTFSQISVLRNFGILALRENDLALAAQLLEEGRTLNDELGGKFMDGHLW